MPLLTVRLSDEDYAALKALAGETSMAGLIRAWIGEQGVPTVDRLLELEDEVKRLKRELALRPGSRYAEGGPGKWDTIKKAKGVPTEPVHVAAPARRGDAAHLVEFRPAPKPASRKR